MKNIRTRNILIKIMIIFALSLLMMTLGNIYISRCIAAQRKAELENIVGAIMTKYPELSETELMEALKGRTGDASVGRDILTKYGYDEDYYKINFLNERNRLFVWNGVVLFLMIVSVMVVFLVYHSRQNSKIKEIADYLSELNKKNYDLKTGENDEDDLTMLRNEIYRTTRLLRETSEYENRLNADLSRSMEDISHQLRTPLASITIMLDNIYDDPDMPVDMRQDFIRSISMQISWMSSLVNSMLKLAKFDAGTIKLNAKPIDVEELLEDCLNRLSVIIELKNVDVSVKNENNKQERVTFIGDYKWEREALSNIIKNAVEHSEQGSKVWIDYSQNAVYTEILIRDEGEGMSDEDLKHIFERFYKAKNASAESIGIGLSLAKCIVEADNGDIKVESQKGESTVFRIQYMKRR